EMGLFPLIGGPALQDLLAAPGGDPAVNRWFSVIIAVFLVGAATGGVVFGWLGDRIGRVRAMSLSIFTYAVFTGLCGLATEAWHIAALRFIASLGMGGEWSLGVALVNEVWPGRSRAFIAAAIGAAANVGFLAVGLLSLVLAGVVESLHAGLLALRVPEAWADRLLANSGWRFLMISGALPAALIFFIRLFVPESARWERERDRGATSHWAAADLNGVLIGCVGALTIVYLWSPVGPSAGPACAGSALGFAVALLGYLHPVRKYLSRAERSGLLAAGVRPRVLHHLYLGTGLAGVALLGTWGSIQWAPRWAHDLAADPALRAREYTQIWLALGAIAGTVLAAYLCDLVGRRATYTALCLASMAAALFLYQANHAFGAGFLASVFVAGCTSAAFYGFFPLYFPELFPTSVRATGQGFAYNFGRIIAAVGGLQTATLMNFFDGSFPKAGSVLTGIYLLGILLIRFCPETRGRPLPD
ncbi:MAG TPA: MFS transporter, partial [Methylomirabilota bacterium]|nr:MFS transporter [Methylomirabilota bacterium]